jgi:hypothetical protein
MADTLDEMVEVVKGFVGDSGVCSPERAKKAINQARRLLWNKRGWNSTSEYVNICCVDCCFTLPNRYEQIKLAWLDKYPATLSDEWFNSTAIAHLQQETSCHRMITEIGGRHVIFQDYLSAPYQIGVMVENPLDVGVELMFEAQDEYSTYHNVKVTTIAPPQRALTSQRFVGIRTVSKPKTNGRIRVYAYNPDSNSSLLLAIYHPNDINPVYRRFRTPKKCHSVTLYAGKKFFDLEDGKELVEFSADAMIYAILALNSRENRKPQEFLTNLSLAVQEEEKVMEDDEIPTAAPIKFADYRRPENLIVDTFTARGTNDYFYYP